MEKSFISLPLLLAGLLVAGCSDKEDLPSLVNEQNKGITNSNIRTVDEAAEVARRGIKLLEGDGSRSSDSRTFSNLSAKVVTVANNSRSTAGVDTLMYVFNFDDNMGFALVAADKRIEEDLLAVTELGSYEPGQKTKYPVFNLFMESLQSSLQWQLDSLRNSSDSRAGHGEDGGPVTVLAQQKWEDDTVIIAKTNPRLGNLRWGQDYPEGMYAPNKVAGCVPLAAALAQSYFRYPERIDLTYDYFLNPTLEIHWGVIKIHRQSTYYLDAVKTIVYTEGLYQWDRCNDEGHEQLAKICRQLGHWMDTDYSEPGSSSTTLSKLKDVMKGLGFNVSETQGYSEDWAISNIDRKNSIILPFVKLSDAGGHCWVIDGINFYNTTTRYYIKYDDEQFWRPNGEFTAKHRIMHMNWGWRGYYNGWFSAGVFNPKSCAIYDEKCTENPYDNNEYYTDYSLRTEIKLITVTKD